MAAARRSSSSSIGSIGSIGGISKRRRKTGRSWVIDVASKRVVGSRTTLTPWRGLRITLSTGAFSFGWDGGDLLLEEEEEEEIVTGARGWLRRRLARTICTSRLGRLSEWVDGEGDGEGDGSPVRVRALYASVHCTETGDDVDVTHMFNERGSSASGLDMTELVSAMAAKSANARLSALVDDPRARLFVVLFDLRELAFGHGDTLSFHGKDYKQTADVRSK